MSKNSVLCTALLSLLMVVFLTACFYARSNGDEEKELRVTSKLVASVGETGDVGYFFWSPDGGKLIYTVSWVINGWHEQDVMLVDLAKTKRGSTRLNEHGTEPTGTWVEWSYDSKKMLFKNFGHIADKTRLLDLETGKERIIRAPENWTIFQEDYSPVSNVIVCSAIRFDTSSWVNLGEMDEGNKLAHMELYRPWRIALIDLDKDEFKFLPIEVPEKEQFCPKWSSDGNSISFCAGDEGGCCCESYYSYDLTTGKLKKLDCFNLCSENKNYKAKYEYCLLGLWEKQGIQIIGKYGRRDGRYYGAWAYKIDGSGEMKRLTEDLPGEKPSSYYQEYFSPDLRYVADLYVENEKTFLRIRELETGKQKLLDAYAQAHEKYPIAKKFPIAWSPDGKNVCCLGEDSSSSSPVIMVATIEQ